MRRPDIHRNVAAIALIVCVGGIVAALTTEHDRDGADLHVGIASVAFVAGLAALMHLVVAYTASRKYAAMTRGEDVIARWHVDADLWTKYQERLQLKPEPRPGGVEVIIGDTAAIVDGKYQSLRIKGDTRLTGVLWYDGTPPYFEFSMVTTVRHSPRPWPYRVPTGDGDAAAVRRVYDHYIRMLGGADR